MRMISGRSRRALALPLSGGLRRRAARFAAVAAAVAVGVAGMPSAAQAAFRMQYWGVPGDIPVRGTFIPGETKDGFGVYRPSNRTFYILSASGVILTQPLGGPLPFGRTWKPMVADYDGDGLSDFAVHHPAITKDYNAELLVRLSSTGALRSFRNVSSNALLLPADFTGDGRADLGTYTGLGVWSWVDVMGNSSGSAVWGQPGDIPVPGHWNDHPGPLNPVDLAVFRPLTGEWWVRDAVTGAVSWYRLGRAGDIPVPAAWGCSPSRISPAAFRPSTGQWLVQNPADTAPRTVVWGVPGDIPVPGDYLGDAGADITIWRPSDGSWWIQDLRGLLPDLPACPQIT